MIPRTRSLTQRQWPKLFFFYISTVVLLQHRLSSAEADLVPLVDSVERSESDVLDSKTNTSIALAVHPSSSRRRRDIFHLYNMMTCATNCDPLSYKGYGCYCGFLGSGNYVDGIDRCCKIHDYCYGATPCKHQSLIYFIPYKWKCNGGRPFCVTGYGELKEKDICAHHLCECDRQFAECIRHYPCPSSKPTCVTAPWRSLG